MKNKARASTRKLLFVLGMHRSGTSALTGVLAKLGAELPHALMGTHEINEKGFFESTVIMAVNNELLTAHGSSWRDFRPLAIEPTTSVKARITDALKSEYEETNFVILKDPRICRMVPIWEAAATDLGYETSYVLPYRHPLEVAKSLEKRDSMPIPEGLLLWLRHVLEAEYMTRDKNRAFVSMAALLDDWKDAVTRISRRAHIEWPYSPDSVASEIDAFLDKDLRHQVASGPDPDIDPMLTGWIMETFSSLRELDAGTSSVPRLDDIRHELDEACRLFGPALHGRIERAGVLERGYNAKNQALGELKASADKMNLEHVAQSSVLQAVQDEKKSLTERLQTVIADKGYLTAERDLALSARKQLEDQYAGDLRERTENIRQLTDRLKHESLDAATEKAGLMAERDLVLSAKAKLDDQYTRDIQEKGEIIRQLTARLQQEAVEAAAEKARLLTERDGAIMDLRLAEEKNRTELRKAERNLSAMVERTERAISLAAAESARLAGERDQLSLQLADAHRAYEVRLSQMHNAQFAAAETIGGLKSDLARIEQAAAARESELAALNEHLSAFQAHLEAQERLLGRYTGARRIDFLEWAFRKSRRPKG